MVHIPEGQAVVVPPFVEHIGIAACGGYEDMLEIIFNDGLKSIGKWAFIGAGISRLYLPDSLVSLGEDCFLMADLEKVRLSNSLEAIPDGCFNLCIIEEITIPSSVRIIGNASLRGLLFVDEIDIPEGVERIGYDAIEGMNRVSLPSTLTEIASDFYYEECIDDPDFPPYITVHPDNKTFFSKNGSLFFRETGKLALDSEYHGKRF
ncbi:MAG: leucine-rich repeat domain-containing protein [Prevotella sp.]